MKVDPLAKPGLRPVCQADSNRCLMSTSKLSLLSAGSIAVVLGFWSGLAWSGLLPRMFLPSPWDVAMALVKHIYVPFAGSTLQQHLLASLGRFLSGFALAVALGVPMGLAMGWFTPFRHAIAPFFEVFRFIAPLAWVPFAALWFGTGSGDRSSSSSPELSPHA